MKAEVIVAERQGLAEKFVADLEAAVRAAPPDRAFTLAVPGGSVAEAFFPSLAAAAIDWTRVEIFWTDERAVAATSPDSNVGLARRLWLEPARVPHARIHPMDGTTDDLAAAAAAYDAELRGIAGMPPVLDYVLLGVGED